MTKYAGTAQCIHVHSWPCVWYTETRIIKEKYGEYPETVRVVEPEKCPICGEQWDEITT